MTASEIHTPITGEELAHTFEEQAPEVDLRAYAIEDWVTFAIFWLMTLAVFLQFFTRYVLNNSFAWTEEIATYCLVVIVFIGAAMCVRLGRHIHVDFLFRYLPAGVARVLATAIDVDPDPVLRLRGLARLVLHGADRGRDDDDDQPAQEPRLRRRLRRLRLDVRALHPGVGSRTGGGATPSWSGPSFRRGTDLRPMPC